MFIVLIAAFTYKTKYCKTEVTKSMSPDGRHTLIIFMIGEPDWPFGPTHCRYDFYEGTMIKEKYSDTVFNDGKNACDGDFEIYWQEECVNLVVHGEEQKDKEFTFFFDERKTEVIDSAFSE